MQRKHTELGELISMEILYIKHSGDQRSSPDVPFYRTFSQMTYIPYWVLRNSYSVLWLQTMPS